jgi:hypothetical protein
VGAGRCDAADVNRRGLVQIPFSAEADEGLFFVLHIFLYRFDESAELSLLTSFLQV